VAHRRGGVRLGRRGRGAILLATNREGDEPAAPNPTSSTTEATVTTTEASPTTVPEAAASSTTSTVPEEVPSEALGDSFFTGILPAGTYAAARFPVPMVFEFDGSWSALGEDPLGGLLLSTSPMECNPDCGPVDGYGVVIRQIEGTPDELAATYVEQLGAPGTLTGAHLVTSEITTGEYAGYDAVTVDFTMDNEHELGATVAVLWPYDAEQGGIKPLIFPGASRTVFVDAGIGYTVVVHLPHADVDGAAAFQVDVEELIATGVTFVTDQ